MANRIEIVIDSVTTGLEKGLKKTEHGLGRFKYAALGAGIAVAGGLAVGLEKSVHAAVEAQKTQARLDQAFRAVGISAKSLEPSMQRVEANARKLGFTNDDVRIGLGSLVTATGNYKESVKELAIAEDLARYKGVSLADATKALTMLHAGSTRALKQLGLQVVRVTSAEDKVHEAFKKHSGSAYLAALNTAKLTDKQLTAAKTLQMVTDRVHGQAQAYSQTAVGAMAQFHAQLENIEVQIGNKLLPTMTKALLWIMANYPKMAAEIKQAYITDIRPPLVAMIALVQQVVATIRTHWSTIGPIVKSVAAIIRAQVQIITAALRIVTALLRGDWQGAWNAAKTYVAGFVNYAKAELNLFKGIALAALRGVVAGIRALAGLFLSAGRALGSAIIRGIIGALSGLAGAVKNAIQSAVSSAVSSVHIPTPHITTSHGIPTGIHFKALGGAVSRGSSYIVGERGPEMFTPGASGSITPNNRLGAGKPIQVNLQLDGKTLAAVMIDPLRSQVRLLEQRTGRPVFG